MELSCGLRPSLDLRHLPFEQALAEKGLVPAGDLSERKAAWRQAFLDTPHGQPVVLDPEKTGQDGLGPARRQARGGRSEPTGAATQ